MKESLISVIVPVYNAADTLRKCVDSILGQSYRNFELLIVDDGSTDNSKAICDEYAEKDQRVKAIHQGNGGVSRARNHGLQLAKGEWIAFVDSDDWVGKDYLQNLMKHAESSLVVGGHITIGDIENVWKPNATRIVHVNFQELPALFKQTIHQFVFWFVWGKLFRRDILSTNHIVFSENMKYSEDNCFVLDYMSCIDVFTYAAVADYMHKQEFDRAWKYSMNCVCFRRHVTRQEESFVRLEEKASCRFPEVRRSVHRRMFACFVNHLLKAPDTMTYYQEISQFKGFDHDGSLLREVSDTRKSRLKNLVLFTFPWQIGYMARKQILRFIH